MKNLKKLVALFAAATLALSMSVSAFAEVIEAPEMYDATEKALVLDYTSADEEYITMMAYLVPSTTTADAVPEYTNQTIIALNQDVGSTGFATIPIDETKLAEGNSIVVKIGGSAGEVATYLIAMEAEAVTYSVTIDYNGGTGDELGELTFGDEDTIADFFTANPITAPTKVDPEGAYVYEFIGWATTADATEANVVTTSTEPMTSLLADENAESVTLYAVYSATAMTPAVTVTFMNGADVHAVVEVDENGNVALPETDPTLTAAEGYAENTYTFVEWVTEDGTAFTADTVVEANTIVYPKFEAKELYGDVNNDGALTATDITYIRRFITSNGDTARGSTGKPLHSLLLITVNETTDEHIAGDVNEDNALTATDITYIRRFITSNGETARGITGRPIYVINK